MAPAASLQGAPAYCEEFDARNFSGRYPDGSTSATDEQGQPVPNRWFGQSSFAQHAIAAERDVVVVDPDLPLELLGPLGCGIQTGAGAVLNEMARCSTRCGSRRGSPSRSSVRVRSGSPP